MVIDYCIPTFGSQYTGMCDKFQTAITNDNVPCPYIVCPAGDGLSGYRLLHTNFWLSIHRIIRLVSNSNFLLW